MKIITIIIAAAAIATAQAEETLAEVKAKIIRLAEQRFPDDYVMQVFIIEQQI
jgi:hypothetical protein